jgi:hypothetical protein
MPLQGGCWPRLRCHRKVVARAGPPATRGSADKSFQHLAAEIAEPVPPEAHALVADLSFVCSLLGGVFIIAVHWAEMFPNPIADAAAALDHLLPALFQPFAP